MNTHSNLTSFYLVDENATVNIGALLANIIKNDLKTGLVVYLHGDLGAGKTTLTRGFIQAMGHKGNVKSPTYTLVEPYELELWNVYHFDLYRLGDPEELEFMGIRDYFNDKSCCFIEWPEKGLGVLAKPDLIVNIEYVENQRRITFEAKTPLSEQLLTKLTLK